MEDTAFSETVQMRKQINKPINKCYDSALGLWGKRKRKEGKEDLIRETQDEFLMMSQQ